MYSVYYEEEKFLKIKFVLPKCIECKTNSFIS